MPDSLYALALLACPVGMGAMMWMMNRHHQPQPQRAGRDDAAQGTDSAAFQAAVDQRQAAQRW